MVLTKLVSYKDLEFFVRAYLGVYGDMFVTMRVVRSGVYAHLNNGEEIFISVFKIVSAILNNSVSCTGVDEGLLVCGFTPIKNIMTRSGGTFLEVTVYRHTSNAYAFTVNSCNGRFLYGRLLFHSFSVAQELSGILSEVSGEVIGGNIVSVPLCDSVFEIYTGIVLATKGKYLPLDIGVSPREVSICGKYNGYAVRFSDILGSKSSPFLEGRVVLV